MNNGGIDSGRMSLTHSTLLQTSVFLLAQVFLSGCIMTYASFFLSDLDGSQNI